MAFNSVSSSKLHCCIFFFILVILAFLSFPFFLIYLANNENEVAWERNQTQTERNLTCSQHSKGIANNEGQPVQCPVGSFPCVSCPGECVKQSKICDGNNDCPDRSDESSCHDSNGVVGIMFKHIYDTRTRSSYNISALAKPDSCELEAFFTEQCACNMSEPKVIICDNHGLTGIPDELLSSVFKIRMGNNLIESLDNVHWPQALTSLALESNRINRLGARTFKLAPNLIKLYLSHNSVAQIDDDALEGLENLSALLMESNRLRTFNTAALRHTQAITRIYLSENQIDLPPETRFSLAPNLKEVNLDHNQITTIKKHYFSNMPRLYWLSLTHNLIDSIEPNSFEGNYQLSELNLSFNRIKVIDQRIFAHRLNIQRLYLDGNPIESLGPDAFRELMELKSLNLTKINFRSLDRDTFAVLRHLEFIYFEHFRFCHYATRVRVCRPITDGLSSKEQLLAFPILKYAVWIVATVCSVGNVFVFVWRSVSPHEDQTLSLFVKNLSIADLMMGVYLCTIGWQDWKFQQNFRENAIEWMASWQCTAIGSLAILSTELSVFILTIITVERYRAITSIALLEERAQKRRARLNVTLAWLFSMLIAFYPLLEWWRRDSQSYATNGLCLPLHIEQPWTRGWEFIYLGINFLAVIVIIGLYAHMYVIIIDGHQTVKPVLFKVQKREDAILALRFFFIVLTDCLSWIPIVVIKILALAQVAISPSIYGWLVVFIIPINSALNPIVYTLAAPTSLRTAFCRAFGRLCLGVDHFTRSMGNHWHPIGAPRKRANMGSHSTTTTCDTFDTSITSKASKASIDLPPLSKESSFSTSSSSTSSPSVTSNPGGTLNLISQQDKHKGPFDCIASLENSSLKHSIVQLEPPGRLQQQHKLLAGGEDFGAREPATAAPEDETFSLISGDKKPVTTTTTTTRRKVSQGTAGPEKRPAAQNKVSFGSWGSRRSSSVNPIDP